VAALIDSHLHLYRHEFDGETAAVRERARAAGVRAWIHVGYNPQTNELAQELAAAETDAFATAGLHPHEAEQWNEEIAAQIRALAEARDIVAIGECGLDFFRDLSPREAQAEAFRGQIRLAKDCDLPMIHHVRDAYSEARAILEDEGLPPRRGIFHAFAGDEDFARWATDEGYGLGIGGPITYRSSQVAEFLGRLPLQCLQLETDAPWLPPQPWRGQRNEPAYARITAERIAELHQLPLDELATVMARQFEALFQLRLSEAFWSTDLSFCGAPAKLGQKRSDARG
jgi:TatD DNase family protein